MPAQQNPAARMLQQAIFASRWLLAPLYAGLVATLVLLLIKFVQKTIALLQHALSADFSELIVGVLSLVDVTLVANLVLIVMFSGYENFVSKFDLEGHRDRPQWMEYVDLDGIKLKLLTSIIAISAISLLETVIDVGARSDRELAWGVGIFMAFVIAALLLAIMDRLASKPD